MRAPMKRMLMALTALAASAALTGSAVAITIDGDMADWTGVTSPSGYFMGGGPATVSGAWFKWGQNQPGDAAGTFQAGGGQE